MTYKIRGVQEIPYENFLFSPGWWNKKVSGIPNPTDVISERNYFFYQAYTFFLENSYYQISRINRKNIILLLCMNYILGVYYILCFFLKILWFLWTLPVLLQRWCSTGLVCVLGAMHFNKSVWPSIRRHKSGSLVHYWIKYLSVKHFIIWK